jgi:hypothetical protein
MPELMSFNNFEPIEVATPAEIFDFCNRVRELGGGELLEALIPGRPGYAGSCLIARNLNFSCDVARCDAEEWETSTGEGLRGQYQWSMYVDNRQTAVRVAEGMGLEWRLTREFSYPVYEIRLPLHIGNAAFAFDADRFSEEFYV